MPPFRYHRPAGTAEALELLGEFGSDAKALAGGQSLLPLLALRLSRPAHLVDIGGIAELAAIEPHGDGGLSVGATARHATVEASPVVAGQAALLAAAMPYIGHRAIRNRGTVGGSLAHADPAAELVQVDGAAVETVESLAAGDQLHAVQQGMWEAHAFQCAFCAPGLLMTARCLLERNPAPTREEIRDELSGNLCRCTGYTAIIDGVEAAAAILAARRTADTHA